MTLRCYSIFRMSQNTPLGSLIRIEKDHSVRQDDLDFYSSTSAEDFPLVFYHQITFPIKNLSLPPVNH